MRLPLAIRRKISRRQNQALSLWNDKYTTELLYGGGARGGKSRLFAQISIDMCTLFPGCRGGIGRESLKDLKATFLLTFYDQAKEDGLKEGIDFKYNENSSQIQFTNGSIIFLIDLGYYPTDPDYDRLGGYEITFGVIEEAQQVQKKAKSTFKSRICYRLDEFGLIPKLGMTCNPGNNWTKTDFYNPWRQGKLPSHCAFVPALATDNPFCPASYIEELRRAPTYERERLLYGNWDYDDDPARMMTFDEINDLFTNVVAPDLSQGFIICDAARMGGDYMTVSYWEGLVCRKIAGYKKKKTTEAVTILEEWRNAYKVPKSFTMVDEGGVGGGIVDQGGYKGFMASRSAFNKNYGNLRAECSFKLAEMTRTHRIKVETENPDIRRYIVQDLEQIRRKDPDKDGRLMVVGKDKVKERIGRSPDWGDNLMMRMWYEVSPRPSIITV